MRRKLETIRLERNDTEEFRWAAQPVKFSGKGKRGEEGQRWGITGRGCPGGAEVQKEGTFPNVHSPSPTILQLQGLPPHCQGQMSPQIFISFLPFSQIANFLLVYILHIATAPICHNI